MASAARPLTVGSRRWLGGMRGVFLTCFNRDRQTILFRRQRASREFGERARWAVGLIEINDQVTRSVWRIDVKVTSRRISCFAARLVGNDHEQTRLVLLGDRVEPVFLAVEFKLHCTR